jgi:hypothetical protein
LRVDAVVGEPRVEVDGAVADPVTDLQVGRALPEIAPLAQCPERDTAEIDAGRVLVEQFTLGHDVLIQYVTHEMGT